MHLHQVGNDTGKRKDARHDPCQKTQEKVAIDASIEFLDSEGFQQQQVVQIKGIDTIQELLIDPRNKGN